MLRRGSNRDVFAGQLLDQGVGADTVGHDETKGVADSRLAPHAERACAASPMSSVIAVVVFGFISLISITDRIVYEK